MWHYQGASPSPVNHTPPPGVFTTGHHMLLEEQQANTFDTSDPSSSLQQAILVVDPATAIVDSYPSVSPMTALAMAAVDTMLPAFTVAQDPTQSVCSSPSPMLGTGSSLPLAEAPVSGNNLAATSPLPASIPAASWEGHAEAAHVTYFPTSSDLELPIFPSLPSLAQHDSLSLQQGGSSDVDMDVVIR